MAKLTITSANSVYMLSVAGLFPAPQRLQGFAADDAFSTEQVQPAEVVMGVDGRMSAGYLPTMTPQTISIQADSESNFIFDEWQAKSRAIGEVFWAQALITLPGIGRSWTLTNGILTGYTPIPDAKKVLQARTFSITWENVSAVPL